MQYREMRMTGKRVIGALVVSGFTWAGTVLTGVATAAGDTPMRMDIVRLSGTVVGERNGATREIPVPEPIGAGERVHTATGAHAGLQLGAAGLVTLGPDTTLRIHSLFPPAPPGRMGMAKLVLEEGSANIDTRPQDNLPPSDVRLNVGDLKLRLFGAAIWASHAEAEDEICLLHGAVEVLTRESAQRLDEPGSCLQQGSAGMRVLSAREAGSLASRIAGTAFPDPYARTAAVAKAAATPAPAPTQEPLLQPAASQPQAQAPAQAQTQAQTQTSGNWAIVLASVSNRARAEQEAERLRGSGLDARVVSATRGDGAATWRIVSGAYASKPEAESALPGVRAHRGFESAWVANTQ